MSLGDLLHLALGRLGTGKLRTALTALGVIIGVGAVIAMTEIGQGSKVAIQKTIASMGANNLMLQSGAASSGGTGLRSVAISMRSGTTLLSIGRI